ncbi:hypothetical protein HAX54_031220 [Datura stramonium]|uniref:Uncharacterized protein n=1 Tax=Datura stramonium TaxID=4076 RepID=A0ABS8SBS7_DATST|nr:hypothetical protein [Datura stramonium]
MWPETNIGMKVICSKCRGHNKRYCKAPSSQAPSESSQVLAQSSKGTNQPASRVFKPTATSILFCDDTTRVRRLNEPTSSRGRVATEENSARGGLTRPTNVGFGIYTSASGTQILNACSF